MNSNEDHTDVRLRKLLSKALVPPGYRPKNNEEVEALLDIIGGEPLDGDKFARMMGKIQGREPIGHQPEQEQKPFDTQNLSEQQQELLALYRAKGKDIPPEIEKVLEDMRRRAVERPEQINSDESS